MTDSVSLMTPLVCPRRDLNVDFINDVCRQCGRPIMRHKSWPAWVRFLCAWCLIGAGERSSEEASS